MRVLGSLQVVLYPIVNLRELRVGARAYVEGLEDTMIRTVGAYGVHARVRPNPFAAGRGPFCHDWNSRYPDPGELSCWIKVPFSPCGM